MEPHRVGFRNNTGSNCYFSSLLQAFKSCQPVMRFIHRNYKPGRQTPVTKWLVGYTRGMETTAHISSMLKITAAENNLPFVKSGQQCSSDLFSKLVASPLLAPFNGVFAYKSQTTITCQCGVREVETADTDPRYVFPMHVGRFSDSETTNLGDYKDECECVGQIKKTEVTHRPQVAVISVDGRGFIPQVKITINDHDYELRAIILHSGGPNGGHYVCAAKRRDVWYLFNDTHVSVIDIEKINLRGARMLFYT